MAIRGDHVDIRIDYTDSGDGLDQAAVAIVGTIRADHTIAATLTLLNTDASPIKLEGRYVIRHDIEDRGGTIKHVDYQEIIFSKSRI